MRNSGEKTATSRGTNDIVLPMGHQDVGVRTLPLALIPEDLENRALIARRFNCQIVTIRALSCGDSNCCIDHNPVIIL